MKSIVYKKHVSHKNAFDLLKCGSYLITWTCDESSDTYTIAWVSRVSRNPPLISIGVNIDELNYDRLLKSDYIGVHLIAKGQVDDAVLRSHGNIPNKKTRIINKAPILSGCCAAYGCKILGKVNSETQTIMIAEVDYSELNHNKTPHYIANN